jgi:hypothetical protein
MKEDFDLQNPNLQDVLKIYLHNQVVDFDNPDNKHVPKHQLLRVLLSRVPTEYLHLVF